MREVLFVDVVATRWNFCDLFSYLCCPLASRVRWYRAGFIPMACRSNSILGYHEEDFWFLVALYGNFWIRVV